MLHSSLCSVAWTGVRGHCPQVLPVSRPPSRRSFVWLSPCAGRSLCTACALLGGCGDALDAIDPGVPVVLHSWTGPKEMVAELSGRHRVFFSLSGHLLRVPPEKALPMVRVLLVPGIPYILFLRVFLVPFCLACNVCLLYLV
jgi:hypothetical protein